MQKRSKILLLRPRITSSLYLYINEMKPRVMSEVCHLRITLCGVYDIVSNLVGFTSQTSRPKFQANFFPNFVGQRLFRVIHIHSSQFLWIITSTSCHGTSVLYQLLDPTWRWSNFNVVDYEKENKALLVALTKMGFINYIEEIDAFPSAKFIMHEWHQCSCPTTIES